MRKFVLVLSIAAAAAIFLVSDSQANIKNRPFSIQLVLNGIQPALNDSAQIWLFSPYWGGDLQYMFSGHFAIVGAFRSGKIYNDSVSTSIFKFNNDRANRRWSLTSVSLGPKFYLNKRGHTTPYAQARFEMLMWNIKSHPAKEAIVVENADGNARDYKATELGITLGLGLEQLLADRIAFTLGAEYTHFTGIGADFAQWVKNSRSRAILQFGIGVSIHFGGRSRSMLEDTEKKPENPNRISRRVYEDDEAEEQDSVIAVPPPVPVRVDTVNSVPAQVVPGDVDTDSDGVVDLLDKCKNSPVGAIVDRDGCPLDSDNDQVFDGIDRCPQTAAVDVKHVDSLGCAPDSDGDGIPDHRDRCLNTAKGVAVDSSGCVLDSDNDGVENSLDKCPDSPKELPVNQEGCPDLTKIFLKQVYHKLFSSGEVKIRTDQTAVFDSIVVMLKRFPEVSVMVSGYTDDVGPDDGNLQLSQKRADAVKSYLVRAGIAESRITSIGRGESNFMASNRTRSGREQNRRIELEFTF